MSYIKNLESLARAEKKDLSALANELGIDYTDLRRPRPEDLVRIAEYFNISIDTLVRGKLMQDYHEKIKNIKLLVMDIDGVLTDGGMYYSENGDEIKKFNAKDGMAIKGLSGYGIKTAILSNGINKNIVNNRATRIGVDLIEIGDKIKLEVLKKWCSELKISINQVAYIGDDLNDMPCMQSVGLSVCPSDAAEQVKLISNIILRKKGGDACVREFIENYLLPETLNGK